MDMDTIQPKINQGKNIKRLREMLGIKQEVLASGLGITQQSVSELEQKELINEELLNDIAQIMKIPVEAIKNMNEESTYNYINTFNDNSGSGSFSNYPIFNPIEKIIELYREKEELYERMLESEKQKNEFLKKLLDK